MPRQAAIVCSACGARNGRPRTTCRRCGCALPATELAPGFLLAERYEILERLGTGGMGVVHKAHDRLLNETVAIKVLRPEAAQTPEIAARFLSEIKLARAVSHRNVARIHAYDEDGDIRYISMAFVDGVDLRRVVRERGPLPAAEAFAIAVDVAEGLHAIHEEGILHRDLKTSNIMLDTRGVVRVMDFGLAKPRSDGTAQELTAAGQIVGTPEFMSPEQIRGGQLDRRSDIYSLGVVTFELFSGTTPFRGDTPVATLMMHLNDPPPLDGPRAERLPASLIPVLRRALDKEKERRFGTAHEMAVALEQARGAGVSAAGGSSEHTITLTATAIPPVPHSTGRAAAPPHRRGSLRLAAAAVLVGAVLGGLWLATRPRHLAAAPQPVASAPKTVSPAPVPSPAAATVAANDAAVRRPTPIQAARPAPASPPAEGFARAVHEDAGAAHAPGETPEGGAGQQRQVDARVEALLADAGTALEAQRFDDAIALYDQVLKLDPRHQMARIGRATAVNARSAAASPPRAAAERGRSFVAGRTVASVADAGPERALSEAFESSPGIVVREDTAPAQPAGRLEFEGRPATLGPGERYTLNVYFDNPARAPIEIREVVVTNTVNGRKASGPVTPLTRTVAPEQRALLLSLSDFLAANTETWSLEVLARTAGGETYRNQVTWK